MKQIFAAAALFLSASSFAQPSYTDSMEQFRMRYKSDFIVSKIVDGRSPLDVADTPFLRFYPINEKYRVLAKFKTTPGSKPFILPTHSGKQKNYREYGIAVFSIQGVKCTLHLYQSIDLIKKSAQYNDYLFVPFTDMTSNIETYGGGRYLDLSVKNVKGNTVILDFNKCYNPYCAYTDGYNCPIPPRENALQVAIEAGEKMYAKKTE